jgi:hypothetical protein
MLIVATWKKRKKKFATGLCCTVLANVTEYARSESPGLRGPGLDARRPALGAPVFGTVVGSDLYFQMVRLLEIKGYGVLDSYIATEFKVRRHSQP